MAAAGLSAQNAPNIDQVRPDSIAPDSLDDEINRPLGDTTPVFVRLGDFAAWARVDTNLVDFERLNPTWSAASPVFASNLGAWGTPLLGRAFEWQPRGGFWTGLNAYEPYQLLPSQVKTYSIVGNRPFTEVYYSQVNQRNSFVRLSFAHQLRPRLYYSLHFNLNNAFGFYDRQKARHQNVYLSLRWQSKNLRYELRPFYQNYNLLATDNGGIADMAAVQGASSLDLTTLAIQLAAAETQMETNRLSFSQFFHQKAADSALQVGGAYRIEQAISWQSSHFKYFDPQPTAASGYYGAFLANPRGLRHFYRLNTWEHRLAALLPLGGDLPTARIWTEAAFSQRFYTFNREAETSQLLNLVLSGKLFSNPHLPSPLKFSAETQLIQQGNLIDLQLNANGSYRLNDWLQLSLNGQFQRFQPSQLAQKLYVSRSLIWQNDNFNQQNELLLAAGLRSDKLGLSLQAQNITLNKLVYYNETQTPTQDNGSNNILQLQLSHRLKLWKFGLDNSAIWQQVSSPNRAIRLPRWNTYSRLYFETRVFKTMLLRTGAAMRWWSEYQPNGYFPLTQQFYTQNLFTYQPYPVVDYFLNVKIWQARVFVIAENVLQPILQTTYFTSIYQPQPNFLLRFGLYCSLFD